MKLRLQGDSIRLRLTQTEVAQFAKTGRIADAVHLGPDQALTYALVAADTDTLYADFDDDTLTVFVPGAWAEPWADSDEVEFEGMQGVGDGRTLALLVEKDFECLHNRPDEQDAFPHPLAATRASIHGK